jgi:type I restriction enzyme S subunit
MNSTNKFGYKETKVGLIPSDWNCFELNELLRESPAYGANASAEDFKEGGIRYIRITDITEESKLKSAGKKSLPKDLGEKYLLSDGDILLARSGSVGRSLVYRKIQGKAAFAGYLLRFRLNQIASVEYVSQYLKSEKYWTWVGSVVKIGAQPNINAEQYKTLSIPVPPHPEQQKIAAILTAVDDKLDVIARQIVASKTLKQGLMQTLFSRGVGTQDAQGYWQPHTEFKDSEFGEIPQDWNLKTLGQVCEGALQTGPFGSQLHAAEYQDEGIPVLMPKDLIKCQANLATAARISPLRAADLAKHTLVEGDLLFSRRGDVARFALIDKLSEGALCGTGCLKAKPSDAHSPTFLAHLLQLDVVRTWLEQNAVGQTMPNMNTSILSSLPLVVPTSKAEQEEIAGILNSLDAKASMLSDKQALYQTLKRGLMQKLLTGEWRVKLDSPTASV